MQDALDVSKYGTRLCCDNLFQLFQRHLFPLPLMRYLWLGYASTNC